MAILALAGAAFTMDRLFFGGGPAEAHAAPDAVSSDAATHPSTSIPTLSAPPSPQTAKSEPAAETIAQRVAKLQPRFSDAADQPGDDAFAPPKSWVAQITTPNDKPKAAPKVDDPPPEFRLTMIFRDKRRQPIAATLNGRKVELGETVEGYTLLEVSDNPAEALLAGPGGQLRIPLFNQADTDARNKRSPGADKAPPSRP